VGRLAEAEEAYRAALKLKPDDAEAHGNLDKLLEAKARAAKKEAGSN
jgi:Flp pilus assembly protein TadD